jgi:hypothetical protein
MSKAVDFQTNQKTIFKLVGDNDFTAFSEVKIVYNYLNSEIILFKDFLIEGIKALQTTLNKAIEFELQAINLTEKRGVGFLYNEYCNKLSSKNQDIADLTETFHIWSTDSAIGIDTWIYNVGEQIYFEVSPTYRWHFDEPTDLDYKTYEQFRSEYAAIDIIEINKSTALDWLNKCKDILDKI